MIEIEKILRNYIDDNIEVGKCRVDLNDR